MNRLGAPHYVFLFRRLFIALSAFVLVPEDCFFFIQPVRYPSRCSNYFWDDDINSTDSCCHVGRMPFLVRRSLVGYLAKAPRNPVICSVFDSHYQESAC